jgi:hypothetical protein
LDVGSLEKIREQPAKFEAVKKAALGERDIPQYKRVLGR